MRLTPVLLLLASLTQSAGARAAEITLSEAFRAARSQTESVPIAESQLRESRERVTEARGNFLPNLSARGTYQKQNTVISQTGRDSAAAARLTVSDSLFASGRDWAAFSSARSTRSAREQDVRGAEADLYVLVAKNFYRVLAAQAELKNIGESIELTEKRISDLRARNRVGRSRSVEVLAAEAQRAVLEAQLLAAESELSNAQDAFFNATGIDRSMKLRNEASVPSKLPDLGSLVAEAGRRPDVLSLKSAVEAARENVKADFAQHLPLLDATGNYYAWQNGQRTTPLWDAVVTLSVPIFSGGITQARVEESREQRTQAELLLEQRLREAETEIHTYFNSFKNDLAQVKALENAVQLNERNYREQEKEYRLSLTTNIEVLQASTTLLDAKRSLDHVKFQALSDYAQLQAATNQATESSQ